MNTPDSTAPEVDAFYVAPFAIVPHWVLDRLMPEPAEVLRFYVWLNIRVTGEGHRGYKRVAEMAEMLEVGERTVKRWVATLVKHGAVRVARFRKAAGKLGQNVYFCPKDEPGGPANPPETGTPAATRGHHVAPGADQGKPPTRGHRVSPHQGPPGGPSINPDTTTTHKNSAEPLRGSPATAAPPPPGQQLTIIDAEIVEDNTPGTDLAPVLNAGTLTREWVDYCGRGGVQLPNITIKRYAAAIKTAIDERFAEPVIRAALNLMARDRVIPRPALFPTYLARVQVGPELPPERLSRTQAERLRQGETPEDTASSIALFMDIPDPREGVA